MLNISVVIPARNRAHTLPACLESILAQTYPAAEIIVVDDGSTDETREVVEGYRDRGVIYARLPSGRGAQAARNYGVRMASHDWIAFQDSDDLWLENKLAIQVDALKVRGFSKTIVVHGNGLQRHELTREDSPFNVPETAGDCYRDLLMRPAPLFQAMLVSAEALGAVGYLDEDCPAYQEWDTAIRLARQCEFVHIRQPLFVWVWHESDQISKDLGRALRGYSYVLDRHQADFIRHHGVRAWRYAKLSQFLQAVRAGLWTDAYAIMGKQERHLSFVLARLIARTRWTPRGTERLLRWAAR